MIFIIFFLVALIYSSVGLAGGSAYAGFLALLDIPHKYIPSTSQFLNVIVSSVGFFNYRIHLDLKGKWKILLPTFFFSICGVILGVNTEVGKREFYIILGSTLILSAIFSFLKDYFRSLDIKIGYKFVPVISFFLGFITGIVGIGGGIFLSPVLLFAGFPVKEIASITSIYIFFNSSAGFITNYIKGNVDISLALPVSLSVLVGGFLGSYLGSFKFSPEIVRKILITIIFIIGFQILWRGLR